MLHQDNKSGLGLWMIQGAHQRNYAIKMSIRRQAYINVKPIVYTPKELRYMYPSVEGRIYLMSNAFT